MGVTTMDWSEFVGRIAVGRVLSGTVSQGQAVNVIGADGKPLRLRDQIRGEMPEVELPPLVHVSTPSYAGSHAEGFLATVRALVDTLAAFSAPNQPFVPAIDKPSAYSSNGSS